MRQIAEFDLINKFFTRKSPQRKDVLLGIGDDAALLQVPPQQSLVISTDTSVADVHFFADTAPQAIGYKSLAVSLSDLAAMGAEPAWVMLSLTLLHADDAWLQAFSAGFFKLINQYHLQLVGGDTTQGPMTIATQVLGFVPPQQALCRHTAKPGDLIYVTGQLGGAGYILQCLRQQQSLSAKERQALDYPIPRVQAGLALRNIASAAIDISDGLAADLGHILTQSGVGATIVLEQLPLASNLTALLSEQAYRFALAAGDDYELCFTVPPNKEAALQAVLNQMNCPTQCIGHIEADPGLKITYANGMPFALPTAGYEHFRSSP